MQLDGKVVLITGASSGIGRALAIECATRGARLLLAGRRAGALEETRNLLPADSDARIVAADICSAIGRRDIAACVGAAGRLDVLINNAGQVLSGRLEDCDDANLQHMLATNVLAPMALTRDLLPLLRNAASARIVNVGSIFGDIGHPMFAAYCASKFALRGFSDAMRRELAGEGIGVTYAAPRGVRTPAVAAFADLVPAFDMKLDPPEKVAREIVSAIVRGAPTAYTRGPERLFVLVQRLLPRLIDWVLAEKHNRLSAAVPARIPSPTPPARPGRS